MARSTATVYQMPYQNPAASAPLIIPVLVVSNTPDEDLYANIRRNSALDLPWASQRPPHDGVAVMCGGGPSLAEHVDEIADWQRRGATLFAMNAAFTFLREHGVVADYQVICDAKQETSALVDPHAPQHLFASQAHPDTMDRGVNVTLWHLCISETIDDQFPERRRKAGGYALIGGGASVGNSAVCLAYNCYGFRRFELYGYDSSHRGDNSHAYRQDMNRFIPAIDVEWAGKTYLSSVAMRAQAEKFQVTGQALKQYGCEINIHGDGLLPAMWNTPPENLTERDKYRLMWATDAYCTNSPAVNALPLIIEHLAPDGLVLDFGCGTGRASAELARRGLPVMLIDFAGNGRDEEAMSLPFLEWDLTRSLPVHARYGICCDVMEHIPPSDVDRVVGNIMAAADSVFFGISTVPDVCGAIIGATLHLTVRPHDWWLDLFQRLGYRIGWCEETEFASNFVIHKEGP